MLIALCATSCASSRVLRTSEELRVKSEELRAARDSAGTAMDTVKVTTVTDRTRASDRSQLRVKSEELRVRTDTVYIERRDSVLIQDSGYLEYIAEIKSGDLEFYEKIGKIDV